MSYCFQLSGLVFLPYSKGGSIECGGPGIAYDHATDYGPIKPRLINLRRTLVVTTLGSPWWVDRLIMWQPVKRIVKVALLGACARKSKLQYLSLYNSENLSEKSITTFESRIDHALEKWEQ